MPYVGEFGTADDIEIDIYSISFSSRLKSGDAIVSSGGGAPVSTLVVQSGIDNDPASRLIGSPVVTGGVVSQVIGDLLPGCRYEWQVVINTTRGLRFAGWGSVNAVAIPAES